MALTIADIKQIVEGEKQGKRNLIPRAIKHEERLKLHCEATLERFETSPALNSFLQWVSELIPADKFATFETLLEYPIRTVELTEAICEALSKVFQGRNPVFDYTFISENNLEDWEQYRKEKLGEPKVWKTKGFEAMKTAINSILVVDLPAEQETEKPEPYFYWLDINSVLDFETTEGVIDWIAFEQEGDRLAVFDDQYFRIFDYTDKDLGAVISEATHTLGYCPATFFWGVPLTNRIPELKKSPITSFLSALDWLLFFATSKQHADLYLPYPIYWGFEQDCDYSTEGSRGHVETCSGGYLKDVNDQYILSADGRGLTKCPKCSQSRLAGAGSYIEVPPPGEWNNNANLRDPVGIITIDRNSLDYNVEEVDRIEKRIYANVTGYGGEPINDQAINEKQVIASFESRAAVLKHLKKNFERAQEWITETICQLRYGESFVSASISYGTEFYLFSAEELLEMYTEARKAALSDSILDYLEDQYNETRFRNNPDELQRTRIVKNLDPFRHLTKGEVTNLFSNSQINYQDFMLKVNFSTLLARFERENTNIIEFGSLVSFDKKVEAIKQILLNYANESKQGIEQPREEGAEA